MTYTKKDRQKIIDYILSYIAEDVLSLRSAIKKLRSETTYNTFSDESFRKWLHKDKDLVVQYARATERRAEKMLEEIFEIADKSNADFLLDADGKMKVDGESIQRSRLRVDTRKWAMSKMFPKKFGDKIQVQGDAEQPLQVVWQEKKTYKKGG